MRISSDFVSNANDLRGGCAHANGTRSGTDQPSCATETDTGVELFDVRLGAFGGCSSSDEESNKDHEDLHCRILFILNKRGNDIVFILVKIGGHLNTL
jgi:hypothetical protein